VALVTLNRPEKRNALSLELREQIARELPMLMLDDEVGCVVLTGAGSAFCSGMDVTQFGGDEENRNRIADASIAAFSALSQLAMPAVAAVNGPAIAGGLALALHCDVRIASETATFGFGELPRGIPPSYAAARAALPAAVARDLCLTGRIVHAEEAQALGIVSEVVEPEALLPRAVELAGAIAAQPWVARVTKRRILLEREHLFGLLFEEEEQVLRDSLLRRAH
jgi:enoyl-CoA hydratase